MTAAIFDFDEIRKHVRAWPIGQRSPVPDITQKQAASASPVNHFGSCSLCPSPYVCAHSGCQKSRSADWEG